MAGNAKIIKYKKPINFNIGIFIFLVIIIYVLFKIFSYFTSSPVAEYEVQQGTIAANNIYRGLILREEAVVRSAQSGYVNYYVKNGSKVSVNDVVYSIDTEGSIAGKITSAEADNSALTEEMLSEMSGEIDAFMNSYNSDHFSYVASFKKDLELGLTQTLNTNALNQLMEQVNKAEENNTFYRKTSDTVGHVVYYIDGYEDITEDNFSPEQMDASSYEKTNLASNREISANDPVYKLVKSDNWNVIIAVSEEFAESVSDSSSLKIRFCKDSYTTNASFSIIKSQGSFYLNLSLRKAMIRYINDRFIDIELVLKEETGLKIPKTAITTKEFFTVPKEYFSNGGDSGDLGIFLQRTDDKGETTVTFTAPTIYYESETAYYIDSEYVKKGDQIRKSDSLEVYTIGADVDSLPGVYNINKGYAVFKQINVIYENEEYAIIEQKTSYGIALYDHIALDGSKVEENQIVIQ